MDEYHPQEVTEVRVFGEGRGMGIAIAPSPQLRARAPPAQKFPKTIAPKTEQNQSEKGPKW